MDIEKVYELMDKAEKSSFDKIEVQIKDFKLCLEKNRDSAESMQSVKQTAVSAPILKEDEKEGCEEYAGDDVITTPISGVFYVAKEPGAEPFVNEGGRVRKGETVCIIEAMKMMNEISAPKDGVIESVLFLDGEPVAANDALFKYAKE